jgi:hypothetical protein
MPLNNPVLLYAAKLTFWMIFLLHLFMKLKVPPLYILSFLFLAFLVHESGDWAHALMVRVTGHCWGRRDFGGWDFCGLITYAQHAFVYIPAPLINALLLWVGWGLLHPENSTEENSIGCALVFACLPFNMLLGAAGGSGDLIDSLRWMQQHGPGSNQHFVRVTGLVIALLLIVPPVLRTFFRLPGYKGKLIVFPLFFFLPGLLVRLWDRQLNHWLIMPDTTQYQAYLYVLGWFILLFAGWFFTRRQLKGLMEELSL